MTTITDARLREIVDNPNRLHYIPQSEGQEMARELLRLRQRPADAALREAAQRLVAKLDAVHTNARYIGVWAIAQSRLGQYAGPTYTDELAALNVALAESGAAGRGELDAATVAWMKNDVKRLTQIANLTEERDAAEAASEARLERQRREEGEALDEMLYRQAERQQEHPCDICRSGWAVADESGFSVCSAECGEEAKRRAEHPTPSQPQEPKQEQP